MAPDADKFYILQGRLYLQDPANWQNQYSYNITISVTSLSGQTVSKEFAFGVVYVDSASWGGGDDVINGYANSDWLIGGNGNDTIYGNAGDDQPWKTIFKGCTRLLARYVH